MELLWPSVCPPHPGVPTPHLVALQRRPHQDDGPHGGNHIIGRHVLSLWGSTGGQGAHTGPGSTAGAQGDAKGRGCPRSGSKPIPPPSPAPNPGVLTLLTDFCFCFATSRGAGAGRGRQTRHACYCGRGLQAPNWAGGLPGSPGGAQLQWQREIVPVELILY